MSEVFFNTNEVADMLQVDKSTVKRWSDEGKLKCYRTPGGHRKFSVENIYQFMNEYHYGVAATKLMPFMSSDDVMLKQVISRSEFHILQSVVLDGALKLKKENVVQIIIESYRLGLSLSLIFDNIIRPASQRLLDLNSSGKIARYDYILATKTISLAIQIAAENTRRETYKEQDIICYSFNDERNEVEFTAVTTLLENVGYRVMNLGNNVPMKEIVQLSVEKQVSIICLHCTQISNLEILTSQVNELREMLVGSNVFLMLTGEAFAGRYQHLFAGIPFTTCSSFAEMELIKINTNYKAIEIQK